MKDKPTATSAPAWRRPDGPLNIWSVIESCQKLADGTMLPIKFSIQEVPEDRHQETIEFMTKYFVEDEPICKCLHFKDDPKSIHDLHFLWKYCLAQGIVEAAYVLDVDNNISELASVNMLCVTSDETDNDLEQLQNLYQSSKFVKVIEAMAELTKTADARKIYGVDKYLGAFGLTVAHKFRGQKLGLRMLEARNKIGKKYEIPASSTVFTAKTSQILAERAGFKTEVIKNFADILDQDGKPVFPGIESTDMRVMMKRLY